MLPVHSNPESRVEPAPASAPIKILLATYEMLLVAPESTVFCKTFPCEDSSIKMLIPVNEFLEKNGYATILPNEIENEGYIYDEYPVSLSPHGYQEEFVLFIKREPFSKPQTKFLINEWSISIY